MVLHHLPLGTRFYGDCSSLEDVRDRQSAEHINSTIECLEEKQEKSLVKNLLRIKPMERQTAAKARTKGIFDSGLDTSQMAAGRKNVSDHLISVLKDRWVDGSRMSKNLMRY